MKAVNKILKLKCVRFLFSYIGQDTNWILTNGFLNPEPFSSDKVHLIEKGNSDLSKPTRKSIEDIFDTEYINHYQLTESFKMDYFRHQHVSVWKAPTILTITAALPPNICNGVSRINPTYHLCKSRQYPHTAVVYNPTNTSSLCDKRTSCFLQPGTRLTCSSVTASSSFLLSNKPYFHVRTPLSNRSSNNSEQFFRLSEFSLILILF